MRDSDIHETIRTLTRAVSYWRTPVLNRVSGTPPNPFKVLISCILSLRTKDATTQGAVQRLFELAETPTGVLRLNPKRIEKTIYPVGFYRRKVRTILGISRELVTKYGSRVPDDIEELLKLKGVGRKTANLVVTLAYGKPGICVDTHVHRITNRWGYVRTSTPDETEVSLREKLPSEYWIQFNDLLVTFGQNLCHPVSPRCSECPITELCSRVGVVRFR